MRNGKRDAVKGEILVGGVSLSVKDTQIHLLILHTRKDVFDITQLN